MQSEGVDGAVTPSIRRSIYVIGNPIKKIALQDIYEWDGGGGA